MERRKSLTFNRQFSKLCSQQDLGFQQVKQKFSIFFNQLITKTSRKNTALPFKRSPCCTYICFFLCANGKLHCVNVHMQYKNSVVCYVSSIFEHTEEKEIKTLFALILS